MIKEGNNRLLRWLIYRAIVKAPTRSAFNGVWLRQAADQPVCGQVPILLYANHTSWWDGYLFSVLMHEAWRPDSMSARISVMVEADTLRKYGFLRHLGAFGVDRDNPRDGLAAIQHAVRNLSQTPHGVVGIFPQGKFYHPDARPLHFFNGVGLIAKQTVAAAGACALVPIALRYEFVREQKPEAFIRVGSPSLITPSHPLRNDAKGLTTHMTQTLEAEMAALRDDCVAYRFDDFVPLLKGNLGLQQWWDRVRLFG